MVRTLGYITGDDGVDQFKDEMTSLVVHDLKNAMLVIGSSLTYASEVADPRAAALLDALSDAREAAARAHRLIADLIDVARLESPQLMLRRAPIDAGALCDRAVRRRAAQLAAAGIGLAVATPAVAPVQADAGLLSRVIDNIVDNAVRHTPRGGRIAVTTAAEGNATVQIRIGNSGAAVATADRDLIFAKYGRAGSSDGRPGAGLGLYFCRLAVAAHCGRIWCETSPELPAVFVVELPRAA